MIKKEAKKIKKIFFSSCTNIIFVDRIIYNEMYVKRGKTDSYDSYNIVRYTIFCTFILLKKSIFVQW